MIDAYNSKFIGQNFDPKSYQAEEISKKIHNNKK